MLHTIDDERLSVIVVWEPILAPDDEDAARRATGIVLDPRARHFWAPTDTVSTMFQKPLGLVSAPAWDVYLVYAPGTLWRNAPPRPHDFMHQLRALPAAGRLDAPALARKITRRLASTAAPRR